VRQGKGLSQGVGEALEGVLGVCGVKQFSDHRQLDTLDELPTVYAGCR
jgi:hypothetical protein